MAKKNAMKSDKDRRLLAMDSDVRLMLGGIGLLIGVGLMGGMGFGWMSTRMLAQAPAVSTTPVSLSESVQEAWDRLSELASREWRLPAPSAPQLVVRPAPETFSAGYAFSLPPTEPAASPVPPAVAARRFAEVKALSPQRSALRTEAERTVDSLLRRFEQQGFDLEDTRQGGLEVPRIFLAKLPIDIAEVTITEKRKRAFIKVMLPHILRENERLLEDRERLQRLHDRRQLGLALRERDETWLRDMADRYSLDEVDTAELLTRVDVVPPALALAQSIEESGWGTSRFALLGNAVYGQWTWNPGSGIVPENRPDGERYEILRFSSLEYSVAAYMRNLNAKSSYREFREKRADFRRKDQVLDSYVLAGLLHRYSTRGGDYIRTIRSIMRSNDLEAFDQARLTDEPPPVLGGLDFFNKS